MSEDHRQSSSNISVLAQLKLSKGIGSHITHCHRLRQPTAEA